MLNKSFYSPFANIMVRSVPFLPLFIFSLYHERSYHALLNTAYKSVADAMVSTHFKQIYALS